MMLSVETLIAYVPLDSFIAWLADGWRFSSDIAQPIAGYHGNFACMMERSE